MIGRGLIGSVACLMGLSMPATNAEAGCFTNLFRRSHHQAVCATPPTSSYVMGYYYDAQGRLFYGPMVSTVPASGPSQVPVQLDPTSQKLLDLESQIATLRLQVGTVDGNATAGIGNLDKRTTELEKLVPGAGGPSNPNPQP